MGQDGIRSKRKVESEMAERMNFEAEIKKVTAKKTASLDMSYQIVLETHNPEVLSLGALSPETLINVEVTPNG